MQAISFVDLFMSRSNKVEPCTLKLIGITAILMAVKINEDRFLSVEQGVCECENDYSKEMILKMERVMLIKLDFRTNMPTAFDFLQFFLYLSDQDFDFSEIIMQCLSFIYVALIGKDNS
jgi:hypothetical protein